MTRDLRVTVPVVRHTEFISLIDSARGWRSCGWVQTVEGEMSFVFREAHSDFEAALRKAQFEVEVFRVSGGAGMEGPSGAGVDLRVEEVGQADPD